MGKQLFGSMYSETGEHGSCPACGGTEKVRLSISQPANTMGKRYVCDADGARWMGKRDPEPVKDYARIGVSAYAA